MGIKRVYFDQCGGISSEHQATHYVPGPRVPEPEIVTLMKCGTYPDDIKYKNITKSKIGAYIRQIVGQKTTGDIDFHILNRPFDPDTVTWRDVDLRHGYSQIWIDWYEEEVPGYSLDDVYRTDYHDDLELAISNGIYATANDGAIIDSPNGTYQPYFEIEYDETDTGPFVEQSFPLTGATIPPSLDNKFTWKWEYAGFPLEKKTVTATRFRWRIGSGGAITTVNVGTSREYTIRAGTIPSGTMQWQVEITRNTGEINTSPWVTVQVREPVPSTTLIAPKNIVIDAAMPTRFEWSHIIETGTPQKKYEMQTCTDNISWASFRSATTPDQFVVVGKDVLEAGDLYWRVRTYNSDNVAGDWSESAHCIVVAASKPPDIAVTDSSPKFAIRWQQIGQQAYEIELDGKTIAKRFGTESTYVSPDYLAPGSYKIRVRIENKFTVWSDWGETTLNVVNQDGQPITMYANDTGKNVQLSWRTAGAYDKYLVYRNGKKIAETARTSYTDQFAVGPCRYYVYGTKSTDGYFTQSTVVDLTVKVKSMMIAEVAAPIWLPLDLSKSELRETSWSLSASVTMLHYVGQRLPEAEVGEHEDAAYMLTTSWKTADVEQHLAFERLRGKRICLKTPYGRRVVGVIETVYCTGQSRLITSYAATILETEAGDI